MALLEFDVGEAIVAGGGADGAGSEATALEEEGGSDSGRKQRRWCDLSRL